MSTPVSNILGRDVDRLPESLSDIDVEQKIELLPGKTTGIRLPLKNHLD